MSARKAKHALYNTKTLTFYNKPNKVNSKCRNHNDLQKNIPNMVKSNISLLAPDNSPNHVGIYSAQTKHKNYDKIITSKKKN